MIVAQEWTDYNEHDPGISAQAIPEWVDTSFRWYVDDLNFSRRTLNFCKLADGQ